MGILRTVVLSWKCESCPVHDKLTITYPLNRVDAQIIGMSTQLSAHFLTSNSPGKNHVPARIICEPTKTCEAQPSSISDGTDKVQLGS